jgi:hypothetical protein
LLHLAHAPQKGQEQCVNGRLIVLYFMRQAVNHQPAGAPNFIIHHLASLPFSKQNNSLSLTVQAKPHIFIIVKFLLKIKED